MPTRAELLANCVEAGRNDLSKTDEAIMKRYIKRIYGMKERKRERSANPSSLEGIATVSVLETHHVLVFHRA